MRTSSLIQKKYTLAELIEGLEATVIGDASCLIEGVCTIQASKPGHITFLTNQRYRKYLLNTHAAAVIMQKEAAAHCSVNAIITANPHYIYAKVASYFDYRSTLPTALIHPSVTIGSNCDIHPSVMIGANTVIGNHVKLAENVVIGAGCVIGDDVQIDSATRLDAHVTLYHQTFIGQRTHISSGVVIGCDGFGFANEKGKWYRVPQLGGVEIGNDVSIGANTTIDRGAVENTIIEDGVKLDNLIQVAHNVKIGAHTIIAACVGIAGSTTIGKNCMIGGGSVFAGHLSVCDNTMITGMSTVAKSINEPGLYSSGVVGAVPNHEFLKNNARFYRLGALMERVKNLENALKKIENEKKMMDIHEILKCLPHRYPFLLIDKVIKLEPEKSIVAIKNVTINENFFVGHFPQRPVMPGVLILEAMAQAGGILAYMSPNVSKDDTLFYFAGIDNARFRRVVEPGDQLRLEINVLRAKREVWKLEGSAYVGDELACSAEFMSISSRKGMDTEQKPEENM